MRDAMLREIAQIKKNTEQLHMDFIADLQLQLKELEQVTQKSEEDGRVVSLVVIQIMPCRFST